MRDLIFVSLENWDDIWRRNQFLCAAWARRFPQNKILFVGKQQMLWKHWRQGTLKPLMQQPSWSVQGLPNITATFIPKPLPNPVPGGRNLNEKTARDHIMAVMRQIGLHDPLLWLNPNDSGYLIGQLGERGVVYDITDDWELAAATPKIRERIQIQDRELCRRADLVVVCSKALLQSRKPMAKRILLLPNGVDAAHYARTNERNQHNEHSDNQIPNSHLETEDENHRTPNSNGYNTSLEQRAASIDTPREHNEKLSSHAPVPVMSSPSGIGEWPSPVFGYTGTLHRERINLDLVVQLARAYPHGSVVLVGPRNWTDNSLQNALNAHPNLHAPGAVPYEHIPEVMARFDVCVVPHRQSEFVESLNPIKLWEYLACGKPIVSTNVAGFRDYPQFCRIADTTEGFLSACEEALQEAVSDDLSVAKERREEAARHSWESRLDDLLQELSACHLLSKQKAA